jgi:hypothetical protein
MAAAYVAGSTVADKPDEHKIISQPGVNNEQSGLMVLSDPREIKDARQDPTVRIVESQEDQSSD